MHDCVVREAMEVGARRIWHSRMIEFRTDLVATVEAANQDGEGTTAVRQVHLEFRVAVKHASEDQVRGGDRGFEGITQQVPEVVRLCAIAAQRRQRMKEDGQLERLYARQHGL